MLPLHLAAYNADLDGVRQLLADGAEPKLVDEHGFSALHWCCLRARVGEQAPVARALLQAGANANAANGNSETPLIWAVQAGSIDLAEVLLAAGADPDLASNGVTPLMAAAREGDEPMVSFLLEHGADPSIRDGSFDAAAYARHGGHEELSALLARRAV